ncbi:MAG TPA: hypothetical protein VHD85_17105 [Terracidiphilus sp.]|nr:hypothetical protein [Terracidiphilus sp.]
MTSANYESALALAGSLPAEEKLALIRALLSSNEPASQTKHERSILELRGLGAEVWGQMDAQEYVRRERNSWNG